MKSVTEFVVLVDQADDQVGVCEKDEAHRRGLRHRAFSVIVKNSSGAILVQRRANGKYHSPGLWANACCGHPRVGEDVTDAARRRLGEELGFACDLERKRSHLYRSEVGGGMIEDEYVHVFFGTYDGKVLPNAAEVSAIRWTDPEQLMAGMADDPDSYAAWFHDYIASFGNEIVGWRPGAQPNI